MRRHARLVGLDFTEPANPAKRKFYLAFHNGVRFSSQSDAGSPNLQLSIIAIAHPPQSGTHRLIEIDVGGSLSSQFDIKRRWAQIHASIDAAATREPLEPQHATPTCNDRIQQERIELLIKPSSNDRRQNCQSSSHGPRLLQPAIKEQIIGCPIQTRCQSDRRTRRFIQHCGFKWISIRVVESGCHRHTYTEGNPAPRSRLQEVGICNTLWHEDCAPTGCSPVPPVVLRDDYGTAMICR